MDRELQILREAALISMSKKVQQQEAKELAELREAALDSARERKLSSDLQRKRRLETPPSHHYNKRTSQSYESDESGEHTPKMSECDSPQNTPPRDEPVQNTVFTIKVADNMVLKRAPKKCSRSSDSEQAADAHSNSPTKQEDKIKIQLPSNIKSPEKVTAVEESPKKEAKEEEKEEEDSVQEESEEERPLPPAEDSKQKSPEPEIINSKAITVTEVSPAVSKISSVDVPRASSASKKHKKKHKKKKASVKKKRSVKTQDSSSETERVPPKSNRNKRSRSHNGLSKHEKEFKNSRDKIKTSRNGEEKSHRLPRELKKEIINELDSKIDKNIEMLQKAKKLKLENKTSKPATKKVISEISSNEEELLKPDRKKSPVSPKNHKKERSRESKPRSRSPAVPDISVSLKSKREFEQMKAEMNKNAPKSTQKAESKKSTPRKSRRRSHSPPRREPISSPRKEVKLPSPKKEEKSVPAVLTEDPQKLFPGPGQTLLKPVIPKDDFLISKKEDYSSLLTSQKEEMELLGDIGPDGPGKPVSGAPNTTINPVGDAVNVLREDDSFSDSDEGGDVVSITSDKKSLDAKRKKLKKNKRKKNKEEKKRKKKRKKRSMEDDSSSDSDSPEKKKAKVKIDKSELNKIVQFLKQRDEQQKAIDGSLGMNKTAFNPKIISKDAKPIEIKLKSKPKR